MLSPAAATPAAAADWLLRPSPLPTPFPLSRSLAAPRPPGPAPPPARAHRLLAARRAGWALRPLLFNAGIGQLSRREQIRKIGMGKESRIIHGDVSGPPTATLWDDARNARNF